MANGTIQSKSSPRLVKIVFQMRIMILTHRGQGIGGQLIQACLQVAKKRQLQGMYTIGQDTNLSACLFYLKQGFEIGGFDNRVYGGTSQEKAADIYFYQDIKA